MDELWADVKTEGGAGWRQRVWRLAVGGNADLARELGISAAEGPQATLAILTELTMLGPEGRTSKLSTSDLAAALSSCGKAADVAPPSVLPDISPTRGEIGPAVGSRISQTSAVGETKAAVQSPPLRGRCPAGQRGAT